MWSKDILGFCPGNYSNQPPGDGGEWILSLCELLKGILAEGELGGGCCLIVKL